MLGGRAGSGVIGCRTGPPCHTRSPKAPQDRPRMLPRASQTSLTCPGNSPKAPPDPPKVPPQGTPDHLDLPRVQQPYSGRSFFNNMRFRRGETAVWDNPRIPRIPVIPRIGCHRLQHGTPLPHAPGVRMTVVKTKLPQIIATHYM